MAAAHLPVSDDHPFALELASLRTAAARYQHEAHATSVKLQRHSLDTSDALERAHVLERENALLKAEAAILRAHPDAAPHPAALQVPELTLALRRLSDKLTLTEESLLARTNQLTSARSDLAKARFESESAHDLAARAREHEDDAHAKERELERKARFAEEERRLADLVVQEYADLVRTLEGRKVSIGSAPSPLVANGKNDSSTTLVDSLAEGKSGLRKLLDEFTGETERLEADISGLHTDIALLSSDLATERTRAEHDRTQLAQAQLELEKYRLDDNTAAKMVSRYMKFSQSSTDSLQKAMESLRTRHAATTATLNAEIDQLHKTLLIERRQSEKLRSALDELSEDISREAFGRRREISLRLAFLGREEALAEGLRRWIRKARESFDRATSSDSDSVALWGVFDNVMADADGLLDSLNGQPSLDENSPGSVARIIAAQDTVSTLARELQAETDRRLEAERRLADLHVHDELVALDRGHFTTNDLPPLPNGHALQVPAQQDQDAILHLPEALSPSAPTPLPKSPRMQYHYYSTPIIQSADSGQHEPAITVSEPEPDTSASDPAPIQSLLLPDQDVVVSAVDDSTTPTNDDVSSKPSDPVRTAQPPDSQSTITASFAVPPRTYSLKCKERVLSPEPPNWDVVHENGHSPVESLSESPLTFPVAPDAQQDRFGAADVAQPFPTLPHSTDVLPVVSSLPAVPAGTPLELSLLIGSDAGISGSSFSRKTDVFSQSIPSGSDAPISSLTTQLLQGDSAASFSNPQETLFMQLTKVKHRYDNMQRAFRDCHLALKELKKDISAVYPTSDMSMVVQRAVDRLNDFNEDARVELEIRITDEARIISGYETLLSVPGAISDEVDAPALEGEMRAFVDGTDRAVAKATQQFARKLDDLTHDIASIKRTVHEFASCAEEPKPTSPKAAWTSWPASLLAPARPSPAPTFGSVMTSPRLRHASSFSHLRSPEDAAGSSDPFAGLGLRIAMPAHVLPTSQLVAGPPRATPRPRATSTMYMLGLGSGSRSFGLGSTPALKSLPMSKLAVDTDTEEGTDMDSDVE